MWRNSHASSSDTSFLPQPSFFSEKRFTGIFSFGVGITLSFCSSAIFAFPLTFAGCVGRSGGTNTRPLRVTPLNPVIFVTLADNELMSVGSSFLSLGSAYLHGTVGLFWYGNRRGLTTEGYWGEWGAASLVKYTTKGLGFLRPSSSVDYIHMCCPSPPSLPTSSRPWSIICCNRSSTAKHASMLCSAPGCIKQELPRAHHEEVWGSAPLHLPLEPYGGRHVLQRFGPTRPTRLDDINCSPSMIGERVCFYVRSIFLKRQPSGFDQTLDFVFKGQALFS